MFLIVFVTLMISVISLYAQVLTLQTARIYRAQNGFMQTMINWHASAVAETLSALSPTSPVSQASWNAAFSGITGCSVTPYKGVTTMGISSTFTALGGTTVAVCPSPAPLMPSTPTTPSPLMSGYNTANYTFYTVAYEDTVDSPGTYNYVITFVYPADTVGDLSLPDAGGVFSGYTAHDLIGQFMRAAPANLRFGSVFTSGTQNYLAVPAAAGGGAYAVPNWIPAGSVAILTLVS